MRSIAMTAVVTGSIALLRTGSPAAAGQIVGCQVLTPTQIASALGGPVGAGTAIGLPTSCQWVGQQGKRVTLTINRPRGTQSPVDQFKGGKASTLPGITTEPVGGVGDDAYYVYFTGQNRMGCGLVVKKGSSVFEIRVYGFDLSDAKGVAKALAKDATGKF